MGISILLATRDNAAYVGELVRSILDQSEPGFTLVVRDDGSTDETMEIVRGLDDGRFRVLESDGASGSAQNNFFRLLAAVDDDFLMFADADDFWLPDKIEKTLARMRALEAEHGADTPILVHTDLCVADENLRTIAPSLARYEKLSPRRSTFKNLLVQNNVTGCTVMINRALRSLAPQQPPSSVMHDWWLALCAAAFGVISYVDEPLILYRQHGGNQVGAYNAGDAGAALRKLRGRERLRAVYAAMYAQAGCFADTFGGRLPPEELALCRAWESMARRGKLAKWGVILHNGFYKNTLLRNIGQFWAV